MDHSFVFCLIQEKEDDKWDTLKIIGFLKQNGMSQKQIDNSYQLYYKQKGFTKIVFHKKPSMSVHKRGDISHFHIGTKSASHVHDVNGVIMDDKKNQIKTEIRKVIATQRCPFYVLLKEAVSFQELATYGYIRRRNNLTNYVIPNDVLDLFVKFVGLHGSFGVRKLPLRYDYSKSRQDNRYRLNRIADQTKNLSMKDNSKLYQSAPNASFFNELTTTDKRDWLVFGMASACIPTKLRIKNFPGTSGVKTMSVSIGYQSVAIDAKSPYRPITWIKLLPNRIGVKKGMCNELQTFKLFIPSEHIGYVESTNNDINRVRNINKNQFIKIELLDNHGCNELGHRRFKLCYLQLLGL